ncbi:hypothetical protein C8T65DRAFT_589627 [Cerioporus squamosus]|nr:hypothetical protein C8T65DRAFT_589627 [Cerioporus squamosus]
MIPFTVRHSEQSSNPTTVPSRSVTSLQRCAYCDAVQTSDRRLRRCAGCFGVMYCSKECQKRAWREHKPICRAHARGYNDPETRTDILSSGFRSTNEFFEGLMEFVDAHRWAFAAVAKAQMMLTGGIEGGIDWLQNPPKVFHLTLKRREPRGLPEESHLSCLFEVIGYAWVTVEEQRALYGSSGAVEWDRIAAARIPEERELAESNPRYICCLPVFYCIDGIPGMHYTSFFPQYRSTVLPAVLARHGAAGQEQWDAQKRSVVEDALNFCLLSIDTLFPLRRLDSSDDRRDVPLPGRFVRTRGARAWRPLFADWGDYRPGLHSGLDTAMRTVCTDGTIQTVLSLFSML